MDWWDIVKSSRGEAYAKFLEEFGPGVELDSLRLEETEPGLIQLLGDEWHINLEAGEISFHSMTLGHEEFVEGMFREEYPERYKEIGDLLERLILENKDKSTQDDLLQIIGKYYRVFEQAINFIRTRIRNYFYPVSDYNREAKPLMLSATSQVHLSGSADAEKIAQQVNSKSQVDMGTRSGIRSPIIYHIVVHMVDRMIADVDFLRDQNNASRVGRFSTDGESTELRETLIQRYYDFFMEATVRTPQEDPDMKLTPMVEVLGNTLINYINKILKDYMGGEF